LDYSVSYKKSVARDLRHLHKAEVRRIFNKIDKELSKNPEKYPLLTGSFAGLRKFRVGNYRVIFTLLDKQVIVLRIGHRKEVYR